MKQGKSLQELAREIQRQADAKQDIVAPARKVSVFTDNDGQSALDVAGVEGVYEVGPVAHAQMAEYLGVPKEFYDRERAQFPTLFDSIVGTHLDAKASDVRMIRTLDGKARAFLSDSYRRMDNWDVMQSALPEIMSWKDARVASCDITERRMYLKVICDDMQMEINGKIVRFGLNLRNSEVGLGRLGADPFSEVEWCTNGATHMKYGLSKFHVGRAIGIGDDATVLLSDEAQDADDAAFRLKLRDVIRAAMKPATFEAIANDMRESAGLKITGNIEGAVQVLANRARLSVNEENDVLRHLIEGSDLSMWGLGNAVTRAAQDVDTYDRATELEDLGGKLLAMDVTAETVKSILVAPAKSKRRKVTEAAAAEFAAA